MNQGDYEKVQAIIIDYHMVVEPGLSYNANYDTINDTIKWHY